jgi:hypothetical protein
MALLMPCCTWHILAGMQHCCCRFRGLLPLSSVLHYTAEHTGDLTIPLGLSQTRTMPTPPRLYTTSRTPTTQHACLTPRMQLLHKPFSTPTDESKMLAVEQQQTASLLLTSALA